MPGNFYEVSTLLSLKDEATAGLQRFIALLRTTQEQLAAVQSRMIELQAAMAPNGSILAAQREGLAMVEREAEVRSTMLAQAKEQSEIMLASRRESLALAREELATQRGIRGVAGSTGSWSSSAKKLGTPLMWGGVGVLGTLGYATQKAIDFNQTALETDVALGGYNRTAAQRMKDIRALQSAAMFGSETTGFFNAQEIMEGFKRAASSGARPLVEKMGMGVFTAIAPALSQYMDVVGRLKGESSDTAAMEAIQTAHMFGAYDPKAISRILNAQAMLALMMPDRMSTAATTGAYVAPSGINLAGIPQEAILALMATADQSGLGRGRAGSRLKDYVETLGVTQSPARERAKADLGLAGAVDAKGAVDLMKSFDILIQDSKKMSPQAFRDAVRSAFGSPGAVVAAMFGDPKKRSMFETNQQVISQALDRGDLSTIQNILKGGTAGQEALMMARLNNDLIKFGEYGLPIAVRFFDTINPKLKQWGDWMDAHPKDAQRLFDGLIDVGVGMLALGGALNAAGGVKTMVSAIKGLTPVIGALLPDLAGVSGGVLALAGAIGALQLAAETFVSYVTGNALGEWVRRELHLDRPAPPGVPNPRGIVPVPPARPASTPPSAHPSITQHNTVNISMNLPKGSDAANAARIARHLKSTFGRYFTSPYEAIPLGSYTFGTW